MKFPAIVDSSFYKKRRALHLVHLVGVPMLFGIFILIPEDLSMGVTLVLGAVLFVLVGLVLLQYLPKSKGYNIAKYLKPSHKLHISNHGFTLYDEHEQQVWNIPLEDVAFVLYELHGMYGMYIKDIWNDLKGDPPVNRLTLQMNEGEKVIDLDFESHYQLVQLKKILEQLNYEGIEIEGTPGLRSPEF